MNDYREEVYRLMLTINRCTGVYYEIAKKMGGKGEHVTFIGHFK